MSTIPYSQIHKLHYPGIFYNIKKFKEPDPIRYPLLHKHYLEHGFVTILETVELDMFDKESAIKEYEELKLTENFHDYVDIIDWEN